ncbi:hypothetical protein Tco_1333554, partial [Tanacetum coccineum]
MILVAVWQRQLVATTVGGAVEAAVDDDWLQEGQQDVVDLFKAD